MSNTLRMVIVLGSVCIVSALSLSLLYVKTQPRIEQNKIIKERKIKQAIIPLADKFITKSLDKDFYIEECYNENNELVGLIIPSSCQGYAGEIEYLVAINTYVPITITSVKILSHKETPGLGANVTKEKFLSQFVGKTVSQLVLKKESPEGKIDGITGATITSRAITDSLRKLLNDERLIGFINKLELASISTVGVKSKIKPITDQSQRLDLHTSTTTFVQE